MSNQQKKRRILVTAALPYANGDIHLGHLVEHVQTDIWVRFQKMCGHECYFVCADDTHGTPIMLAAKKKKITPEELISSMRERHLSDFNGFLINFDNYYTTNSPESHHYVTEIYQKLRNKNKIVSVEVEQLYDPEAKMFLPDRFVKGSCPKCGAEDQYGDNCEKCGKTYSTRELVNPYSVETGCTPVYKKTEHYFFKLSDYNEFLDNWVHGSTDINGTIRQHLHPDLQNKLDEWLEDQGLLDWDITRDAPYFGFEIPDFPGKYFYVWLDAPIGYIASFKNLCDRENIPFEDFFSPNSDTEMYHFIGKDILYFHTLFWPAMLKCADMRLPTGIFTHGFLTVNKEKMSKSRGTFITVESYLDEGLNPEWLRYYYATKLSAKPEDINLSLSDFVTRVNGDLVGKFINIASRASGFIQKRFLGSLKDVSHSELIKTLQAKSELIANFYEEREYGRAVREIIQLADEVNLYTDENKPWELAKEPDNQEYLHQVCSELINAFRILSIYLTPILPRVAQQVSEFLAVPEFTWSDSLTTLPENHIVKPYKHLLQRIEMSMLEKLVERNKPAPEAKPQEKTLDIPPVAPDCTIDDFAKVDLRVAKVLHCEKVEGSTKLLKFQLDLGFAKRTIFSGIAGSYTEPEKLIGRKVIVVANFPPRKMAKFGMSEGMITSASGNGRLFLLDVDDGAEPGMRIG